MCCENKNQHEAIFNQVKEDKQLEQMIRSCNYSADTIIKIINKIMSLEDVDLVPNICQLILSTMSGLQTIEYTNNNKSLNTLIKVYMNKSVMI